MRYARILLDSCVYFSMSSLAAIHELDWGSRLNRTRETRIGESNRTGDVKDWGEGVK